MVPVWVAVASGLVGIGVTVIGASIAYGRKEGKLAASVERLSESMSGVAAELKEMRTTVGDKFDRLIADIHEIDNRLVGQEARLDGLDERVGEISQVVHMRDVDKKRRATTQREK